MDSAQAILHQVNQRPSVALDRPGTSGLTTMQPTAAVAGPVILVIPNDRRTARVPVTAARAALEPFALSGGPLLIVGNGVKHGLN